MNVGAETNASIWEMLENDKVPSEFKDISVPWIVIIFAFICRYFNK